MEYSTIISERVGTVALITLNRPDRLNALNQDMTDELEEAIAEARRDNARTLMLIGAGRGFCSRADLTAEEGKGHPKGNDRLREKGLPLGYHAMLLREFPRPIVAAVNGVAVGAGLSLALACDIRVSAKSARFSEMLPNALCLQTMDVRRRCLWS